MKAIDKQTEVKKSINSKLDTLKKIIKQYGKNESINWGHVGSMNHVDGQLDEILTFLNHKHIKS